MFVINWEKEHGQGKQKHAAKNYYVSNDSLPACYILRGLLLNLKNGKEVSQQF